MGDIFRVLVALAAVYLIFRFGVAMLRSFAAPVPTPPPEGEMRRVKVRYRCSLCGLEIRVNKAIDEDPPAPRHCMEDMDLEVPVDL